MEDLIKEWEDQLKVTEEFFGDDLEKKKGDLRVMYNNVNGLKISEFLKMRMSDKVNKKKKKMLSVKKGVAKLTGVLATIRNWNANILCLAETQVAWENHVVRNNVVSELRRLDAHAGLVGSSSCAACCDVYKPGGTATVFDGNWAGRITKETDNSKLGRWSCITIAGRNDTNLTIITAYRCCKGQTERSTGMYSSYMQQAKILRTQGRKISPQTAFVEDLEKYIVNKIEKGHEILLNLDANEEWDTEMSGIRDMARRLDLYDIARERHPEGVPPTYVRENSESRIDFMLGSKQVLQNITAYGMAPAEYGQHLGDHRAQFVDLNINAILSLNVHDIGAPSSRRLKSGDPKSVEKYCEKLKDRKSVV